MSSATPTDLGLLLRPAEPADLPEIAELYLVVRAAAVPLMPPLARTPAEVHSYVGGWDLGARDVWVAEQSGEQSGELVGFATFTATWLDSLYVHPDAQGRGVGTALIELALSLRPDGLGLWVFETNAPARRFYRRHGFVEVERTDGSGNEERAPDIRMEWMATRDGSR
ncbi:L-amino acid N-acyltransferase YncA [Nocardioides terrae]|uniref:L-amino acid N-acyltransferase YncA n=1 Tax=Nocardioides terrae TaxID=574651 RepID=A0A1I1G4U4_9ACTN|nr:GNAT family N-acetyltransferase [Nocardioides terrae]SFC04313.1 L-amino acid N-acyltransferase YncA [Nocardioides terrae]